jgi:hypothetical protein
MGIISGLSCFVALIMAFGESSPTNIYWIILGLAHMNSKTELQFLLSNLVTKD